MITILYRIRKKSEPNLYLKGTPSYYGFDKSGRFFKLGQLRTFMTAIMKHEWGRHRMSEWEIVEEELVLVEVKQIHQIISPKKLLALIKDS